MLRRIALCVAALAVFVSADAVLAARGEPEREPAAGQRMRARQQRRMAQAPAMAEEMQPIRQPGEQAGPSGPRRPGAVLQRFDRLVNGLTEAYKQEDRQKVGEYIRKLNQLNRELRQQMPVGARAGWGPGPGPGEAGEGWGLGPMPGAAEPRPEVQAPGGAREGWGPGPGHSEAREGWGPGPGPGEAREGWGPGPGPGEAGEGWGLGPGPGETREGWSPGPGHSAAGPRAGGRWGRQMGPPACCSCCCCRGAMPAPRRGAAGMSYHRGCPGM
jgi:hypothetical protein